MMQHTGMRLCPQDELGTIVAGMAFLVDHVPDECYTFAPTSQPGGEPPTREPRLVQGENYPYLLVNVGSGVSLMLVHSSTRWERVSGTSLGGGTFYGLCHLATGLTSFGEMLELAERGDNTTVDLTVGDIYGGDYAQVGLKASTLAASFGSVMRTVRAQTHARQTCTGPVRAGAAAADVSRALLIMLSNNIGQLAFLCAQQHRVQRVVFAGNFLRHDNTIAMRRLAFAIHFWSQGAMEALFLRHEGYFGALGAFLLSLEEQPRNPSKAAAKPTATAPGAPTADDAPPPRRASAVKEWLSRGRTGSLAYLEGHPSEAAAVEAALGTTLPRLQGQS